MSNKKIEYIQKGDYLYPNIALDTSTPPLTRWGMMWKNWVLENHKGKATYWSIRGELFPRAYQKELQAAEMMERLMERSKVHYKAEIPDKATQQMAWVSYMEMLHRETEQIVMSEIIYTL